MNKINSKVDEFDFRYINYPKTDGALKSLKECATIYEKKLKQKDKAVEMLNTIIKDFPESKDAKRAEKRIKKLNK